MRPTLPSLPIMVIAALVERRIRPGRHRLPRGRAVHPLVGTAPLDTTPG